MGIAPVVDFWVDKTVGFAVSDEDVVGLRNDGFDPLAAFGADLDFLAFVLAIGRDRSVLVNDPLMLAIIAFLQGAGLGGFVPVASVIRLPFGGVIGLEVLILG